MSDPILRRRGRRRTVSHLAGDDLASDGDGRFSVALSRERRPGNWLRLDDEASHVLVRPYFDDRETEVPGVFAIVREVVPFDLRAELPPETPTTTPADRSAVLERRSKALTRRCAY